MATTFKQDMPPKGGYGSINYKRAMPKRGPSGYLLLGGVASVMMLGMLKVGSINRYRRMLRLEENEARLAIWPLMEAERDRDMLRVLKFNHEQEAIIMKDFPNWQAGESPYNTERWIPPHNEDLYYLDDNVKWHKNHGYACWV